MKVSKAVLFAVLRIRHADDRPLLAQRLPDEFETDDFPGLLDMLDLTVDDLAGPVAAKACELSALDGDPNGRSHPEWPAGFRRQRRPELLIEIAEAQQDRRD